MDRLRNILIAITACALIAAAASCNTSGCLENRSALPLAGFYSSTTDESISLDSIEIMGLGADLTQPLIKAGERTSTVYLPMRSTQQSTAWQFGYKWHDIMNGELCDTIVFDYTSAPFFASDECGVIYKYQITNLTYTRHIIDRIEILDSLVTNTDIERLKIYFHTNDE